MDSTITYNGHDIDSFTLHINNFYEQSQFWRNNLFDLPPGPHSKKFINLITYWLDQFNQDTPFVHIALKVMMILPNLLLQKPSNTSKPADHQALLEARLEKWDGGELPELVKEGNLLQRKLVESPI
jgi:hypothetical protein